MLLGCCTSKVRCSRVEPTRADPCGAVRGPRDAHTPGTSEDDARLVTAWALLSLFNVGFVFIASSVRSDCCTASLQQSQPRMVAVDALSVGVGALHSPPTPCLARGWYRGSSAPRAPAVGILWSDLRGRPPCDQVCAFFAQCASGSGIPEIKCFLNGMRNPDWLTFRTSTPFRSLERWRQGAEY